MTILSEKYGAINCACCAIQYGTFEHITVFLEACSDAETIVYNSYLKRMHDAMPEPCDKCAEEYKAEYRYLMESYKEWESSYNVRFVAAKKAKKEKHGRLHFGFDDDICTSSSGLCTCCGECPSVNY
jgi:hypothetical protein